jgi:molybdate transport repressor ModE-like protein
LDKIETMRAFAAVAQEGSFTAAARRLGLSTKLVSKYVQQLESRLATQLLNRTTRSVALTDVGTAFLERCRPIIDQFDELDALVRERQTSLAGPIRITAPTGFGSTRLADALVPFTLNHPDVEIDLRLTDSRVAIVEEGFDLAVRVGRLRDSSLIVRKLSEMPLIVCAAPEYLDRHGRPRQPEALATHNCLIDENHSGASVWQFSAGRRGVSVKVGGSFAANSPGARCPRYVVEAALDDGELERLLPNFTTDEFVLYALYPPNRHLTARVRALIDHLAEWLVQNNVREGSRPVI